MAKRIMTKDQRNDLLAHAQSVVFKAMKTIGKRDQKKVKAGVLVVIKWLDSMPTTEMVLDIDSPTGGFERDSAIRLYNVESRRIHSYACCDQIVAVLGKLV